MVDSRRAASLFERHRGLLKTVVERRDEGVNAAIRSLVKER